MCFLSGLPPLFSWLLLFVGVVCAFQLPDILKMPCQIADRLRGTLMDVELPDGFEGCS